MKLKNILKTAGVFHILLGLLIISLIIFSVKTITGDASIETIRLVRGTANVVAASNLGIGCLLITCSSIKDKASLRKVLSGELVLMFCFLSVALFNTFNAGTIVDGGPPPPFWIVLIVNPLLCIYGLVNNKNWQVYNFYNPILMTMSYWLINSNRTEVKRFIKNEKSIAGIFDFMFIETGKIAGVFGKERLVITTTVSVEIDLAREIYERLLSKGWRKTEEVWIEKES